MTQQLINDAIGVLNILQCSLSYVREQSENEKNKEKKYDPYYTPKDKPYDNENTLKLFVGSSKYDAVLITELKGVDGNVYLSKSKDYKNPIVNSCFGMK